MAEEAYRRHQLLLDDEENASIPPGKQIRIRTSDGALLLPTDPLCTVIPKPATAISPPELIAEIIQKSKPSAPPRPIENLQSQIPSMPSQYSPLHIHPSFQYSKSSCSRTDRIQISNEMHL